MEKNRFKQLLEAKMGNVKPLLNESLLLEAYNVGNYAVKTSFNLGSAGGDYVLKAGSTFIPKSNSGPNAWAYSSNAPWETEDPLIFQCTKKTTQQGAAATHLWEPTGSGTFWGGNNELSWTPYKAYFNNQLEAELKAHFCTAAKPKATVPATKLCDVYKARAANPVQPNAGDIQKFLKELGSNINVDFAFGPGTATAVGTYLYGGDKGINTVQSLHAKLVETGKLPQGDVPGFGPKMAQAVADLLNAAIKANTNCTQAAA
jgi:hypothetical protein